MAALTVVIAAFPLALETTAATPRDSANERDARSQHVASEIVRLRILAQTATTPTSPEKPADGSAAPKQSDDKDKKDEKAGTPATVVDGQQLESVLGLDAATSKGENMGRIVDIIVDRAGQVRAAIIDFGGFLGVGSRKIAIDWRDIHFPAKGASSAVVVDLTRDQLRVAPEYKPGQPVVVIGGQPTKP